MNKKIVKRFADSETIYKNSYPIENQKYIHWVEYTDGTKETVQDETIMDLWHDWVFSDNVSKKSENGFTVFEYNDR